MTKGEQGKQNYDQGMNFLPWSTIFKSKNGPDHSCFSSFPLFKSKNGPDHIHYYYEYYYKLII